MVRKLTLVFALFVFFAAAVNGRADETADEFLPAKEADAICRTAFSLSDCLREPLKISRNGSKGCLEATKTASRIPAGDNADNQRFFTDAALNDSQMASVREDLEGLQNCLRAIKGKKYDNASSVSFCTGSNFSLYDFKNDCLSAIGNTKLQPEQLESCKRTGSDALRTAFQRTLGCIRVLKKGGAPQPTAVASMPIASGLPARLPMAAAQAATGTSEVNALASCRAALEAARKRDPANAADLSKNVYIENILRAIDKLDRAQKLE